MLRSRERGEGKIGCILSLLVMAAAIAGGVRVLPVLYGNYTLAEFAGEQAGKAGIFKLEGLEKELRSKAKDLDIPEALAPGAIAMTATGNPTEGGYCTVRLAYTRKVDLYGIYQLTLNTDEKITKQYIDAR
jgi:hypothetical protein